MEMVESAKSEPVEPLKSPEEIKAERCAQEHEQKRLGSIRENLKDLHVSRELTGDELFEKLTNLGAVGEELLSKTFLKLKRKERNEYDDTSEMSNLRLEHREVFYTLESLQRFNVTPRHLTIQTSLH